LLNLNQVELCVKPKDPFDDWVRVLCLLGYRTVGVELPTKEASEFAKSAKGRLVTFIRSRTGFEPGPMSVVKCAFYGEPSTRGAPPFILRVDLQRVDEGLSSYVGRHGHKLGGLEVSLRQLRRLCEKDPLTTLIEVGRLQKVALAKGLPLLLASDAVDPSEVASALTKSSFLRIVTGRVEPYHRLAYRRFSERLSGAISFTGMTSP
jgi:hypothetical protein